MSERRVALVVATDRYDDATLRGLAAPAADAEALAATLGDPDLGGFEVDVLANAQSSVIAEHVDALLGDRRPSDLVLLHFSCHGLKDESGELYLAATNTRPERLATTAVEAALVNRLMRRSRARRVVLLLDCCYGGAFERGIVARDGGEVHVGEQFAPTSLGGGRGRVVITASSAMEYAFEGGELTLGGRPAPSLFTSALVDGISTGAADGDQDGRVSLDELYDHVFDAVQARTPHQTPSRWEFGVQGELTIARNPRRLTAAVLPPDLVARSQDATSVDVRLSAVDELASLSRGGDLGLAAGAVQALGPLTDDDSRRVSRAAASALQAVRPRPERQSVDLGRIVCGQPARAEVRVEGSPLALASTVQTSGPEVVARLDTQRLLLEVVSADVGPVVGSVTLTGPAGEARLDIVADAVAQAPAPAPDLTARAAQKGEATPARNDRWARRPAALAWLTLGGVAAIVAACLIDPFWPDGPNVVPFRAHDVVAGHEGVQNALLVPAVVALLALACCLGRPKLLSVLAGALAGTAAWSLFVWGRNTVRGVVDVGADTTLAGTFATGHWGTLVGGALLATAAVLLFRSSPDLRARISAQPGWWTTVAALTVVAGCLTPGVELRLEDRGGAPLALATQWVLVLAFCLPVAVLRLNTQQRRAAVTAVGSLCLFFATQAVWELAEGSARHPSRPWAVLLATVLVLAGCLVGQHRLLTLPHPRTPHPPGVAPG